MNKELKETFSLYFQEFRHNEEVNTKIKKLILMNLGMETPMLEEVTTFIQIAEECGYEYSRGLGYAMMFWVYCAQDLELALTYNEKARCILMQLADYEKKEGILTVANNAVMGYISKGKFMKAYQEIRIAMKWAEQQNQITYFGAFLNNSAIILCEFGLYKKAVKQVKETLAKRDIMGENNYYTTIYLLGFIYLHMQDTAAVRQLIGEHEEELRKQTYNTFQVYNRLLLDAAILEDKEEEADALYQEIMENYCMEKGLHSDNLEIQGSLAHYYMYKKQYDAAEESYRILYEGRHDILGAKQKLLYELAEFSQIRGDDKTAYAFLKEAYENSLAYDRIVDALYMQELEDIWEENRMMSYEILYEQLLKITEVGKQISYALDWKQLFIALQQSLPEIFHYAQLKILIYDHQSHQYQIHSSLYDTADETISLAKNPALKTCIRTKQPLYISNTKANTTRQQELPDLYEEAMLSICLKPLVHQKEVIGILYLGSEEPAAFEAAMRGLLEVFSDYLSIALMNIRTYLEAVQQSSYDYLTQAYNRSGLMEHGEALVRSSQHTQSSIGVLMIDIDDFKKVNDTYGHMQGDIVIKKVTQIMKRYKGKGIVARFGGEEFTLLRQGITSEELYHLAEHIRQDCENAIIDTRQGELRFTVSIGCYYERQISMSLQSLLERADQELYIAKHNGKNYVQMAHLKA